MFEKATQSKSGKRDLLQGGGSRVDGWTKLSGWIHKEWTRDWHQETAQELHLRGSVCTQPIKHAESAVLMCVSGVGGDEFSSVCQTTRVSLTLGHSFIPLCTPSLSSARTSRSGTCLSSRYTYFVLPKSESMVNRWCRRTEVTWRTRWNDSNTGFMFFPWIHLGKSP